MNHSLFLLISLASLLVGCSDRPTVYNELASTSSTPVLPVNPLTETVISVFVDPRQHTMSTLYGNSIAAEQARHNQPWAYRTGAVLTLVTWAQQPDPHWFGGNIPGQISKIEVVRFSGQEHPVYQLYSGQPLRQQSPTGNTLARIKFIIQQKVAYPADGENPL